MPSFRLLNSTPNRHLRVSLQRLLCGALTLACLPGAALGRPRHLSGVIAPPEPSVALAVCKSPGAAKIKAYKEASDAAKSALDKMKVVSAPAKADADGITDALKKVAADEATVGQFEKVAGILEAGVNKTGRFGPLKQPARELEIKRAALRTAFVPFKGCEDATDAPAELSEIVVDHKARQAEIEEQLKIQASLSAAVKSIPVKALEFLTMVAGKAQNAAVLREDLASQTLRTDLPKALPDLALAMRLRRLFTPVAGRLGKALDPATFSDLSGVISAKPDFSFAEVNKQLTAGLAKVQGWARQAGAVAREEQAAALEALEQAMADPFHRTGDALAAATVAEAARTDFNKLVEALLSLLSEAQREDFPAGVLPGGFIPAGAKEISDSTRILKSLTARFAQSVQQLSGPISTDKSTWTMASVDLFYFDNVERLMLVLSPHTRRIGGRDDLQSAAVAQRRLLSEASQTLLNADTEVSNRRQEVGDLKERVRVAKSRGTAATQTQRGERAGMRQRAATLERRASALTEKRQRLDSQKTLAQTRLTRAEGALEDDPDNVALQRRVELAQRDLDRATRLADDAKAEEDSATRDATAARADADDGPTSVDDEVEDLEAELTGAQTALDAALTARRSASTAQLTAQREAFLAAQAENFAFAQARDNAPFLTNMAAPREVGTAPATAAAAATAQPAPPPDSDPISRVLLFAFPDTRTIFIRGQRDDIDLVRQIIKEFDEPHGQAVMTLRTIEISSDGTKKSGERALRFLKEVDEKLNAAQANVQGKLSFLREKINEQVKAVADAEEKRLQDKIDEAESKIKQLELKLPPHLRRAGTNDPCVPDAQASPRFQPENEAQRDAHNEIQRLRLFQQNPSCVRKSRREEIETISFYDAKVLEALGWRKEFLNELKSTEFLNAVIPPPSRSVNLAQALIVLSLASVENRKAIVKQLESGAGFSSLLRFLGKEGNGAEIVGFQSRLVGALRFNAIPHVLEFAEAKVRLKLALEDDLRKLSPKSKELGEEYEVLFRQQSSIVREVVKLGRDKRKMSRRDEVDDADKQINDLKQLLPGIDQQMREVKKQLDAPGLGEGATDLGPVRTNLASVENDLNAILAWLLGNAQNIDPGFLRRRIEEAVISSDSTSALLSQAIGLRRSARFRFSQANESAVNLTFRKYLEQVNRDLTETYVKPAFREINEKMLKKELGVGVIQETSILASNRLVARVDPRGSAQLAVGEERDVLEAARQLTNLFGIAGKSLATGVTGNPLALAGGPATAGASTIIGTAQSVLSSLDQMPRGAQPTVYGIATGNLFQVTPVIDPSGQALRFRFDLVSATQIREPNDTIDPQLPRIERHSVNTEVLLADQEIRLISQFQANYRLGVAKRRSGGLPILKDLPGVSEVPLIGWFVKRGGRSAQTQQSLIFCQTTMYPTLGEVLDVAVRSPTFTGLETPVSR